MVTIQLSATPATLTTAHAPRLFSVTSSLHRRHLCQALCGLASHMVQGLLKIHAPRLLVQALCACWPVRGRNAHPLSHAAQVRGTGVQRGTYCSAVQLEKRLVSCNAYLFSEGMNKCSSRSVQILRLICTTQAAAVSLARFCAVCAHKSEPPTWKQVPTRTATVDSIKTNNFYNRQAPIDGTKLQALISQRTLMPARKLVVIRTSAGTAAHHVGDDAVG